MVFVEEIAPLAGLPGTPIVARYGLGIADFGGYLGHNGAVPGYQTIAVYGPRTRTTVVMLANTWILEFDVATGFAQDVEIPTELFPSFAAVLARRGTLPATR